MNQSREAHLAERSLHTPEGHAQQKQPSPAARGARGEAALDRRDGAQEHLRGGVAVAHSDPAHPVLPGPVSVVVAHQLVDHPAGDTRVLQPSGVGVTQDVSELVARERRPTGVVFVQVVPEAKRRQLKPWLDAYEAAQREKAQAEATRRRGTTARRRRGSGQAERTAGWCDTSWSMTPHCFQFADGEPRGGHIRATSGPRTAGSQWTTAVTSGPLPASSPATFG
jgi:hypothetical protein